jgi:hypothetical protein
MLQTEENYMKIAVISTGVKFLPERFANILASAGYDTKFYPLDRRMGYSYVDWNSIDVAWGIGFFFECDQLYDALKSKNPKIRIVNCWVGTDLLNTVSFVRARPKCKKCVLKSIDVHVVDDVSFVKELKDWFGVEGAHFVPSIPDPMPLRPLPKEFAVGCYIPPHRKDFYGYPIIVEVARQMPDVPFYIFALDNTDKEKTPPPLPNVHFIGFVQGDERLDWYSRCSANITIPMHGGVSLTLIEFMQMGRRCISNKELPYVYHVEESEMPSGVIEKLKEIMKFREPDLDANKYYREEYSPKKVLEHIKPVLEAL